MRWVGSFVAGFAVAATGCDYPPNGPWPASAEAPSAVASDGGPGGGVDAASSAVPLDSGVRVGSVASDDAGSAAPTIPAAPEGEDAGAGGCGGPLVCEDFEAFPIGPLDLPDGGNGLWQVETPDCSGTGAIAIDGSRSHGGTRSLEVTGAAGYCNHVFLGTNAVASLTGAADAGPARGPVWARFYVQLASALDADHAAFLALRDTSTNTDLRLGGQSSILMWNRESDDATLPALSPAGIALSVAPTTNAWHCVELEVVPSGPSLQTWVDGTLIVGLVVGGSAAQATADSQWLSNTSWAPHLVDARFGWESYANEAETLWFDDIGIGSARIGCGS